MSCTNTNTARSKSSAKALGDSIALYLKDAKHQKLDISLRMAAINKAWKLNKRSNQDSLSNHILYRKSYLHFSKGGEYDSLEHYSKLLFSKKPQPHSLETYGHQHYLMAYYKSEYQKDYPNAINHYTLSKNFFTQLKDSSQIGKTLMNIGVIQKNQNDFFGSKETLTEALKYLKEASLRSSCYNALATNHRKLLNYEDAIAYYQKAMQYAEAKKVKSTIQNNMAATYIDHRQYENAIDLLSAISHDSTVLATPTLKARILDNLAYAQWLSNPKTKVNFEYPLEIRKTQKDERGQIASYTHLGEYYITKDTNKALAYFDTVINLAQKLKIPRAEKDALKLLMKLNTSNIDYKNRYIFLQDSIYDAELKVKTQFAKYIYDDKVKQESILRLETQNAQHELESIKQRNQKTTSLAVLTLVLLVSAFAAYYSINRNKNLRQKAATAKLEATYETEASLSRKLHDDFGSKLNHAMLLLHDTENEKVLDLIENLYNESRSFSRRINDIDTGTNFKNVLLGMLAAYSKDTQLLLSGNSDIDWAQFSGLHKQTIYRVLQELLINMQKHSEASLISLSFKKESQNLHIEYFDNGKGASKEDLNSKNGLWNTEKRIRAIDGSITFDSNLGGEGFKASIVIPI